MIYKRGNLSNRYSLRGWIAFPIVLLSFSIASLTLVFYQKLSDIRQWNALQAPIVNDTKYWEHFSQQIVYGANFDKAVPSTCYGFCAITKNTDWPYLTTLADGFRIQWNMSAYNYLNSKNEHRQAFRICAQIPPNVTLGDGGAQGHFNTFETRCWWLRKVSNNFDIMGHVILYNSDM